MNYDASRAHHALTQAAVNLAMGNTGGAIELTKQAITLMENSLPPPVVYHGQVIEKHSDQRDR